jgi:Protein of unknown function (DUF4242)
MTPTTGAGVVRRMRDDGSPATGGIYDWPPPGRLKRRQGMPKFMDVHHGMHGVTPEALQAAHQADLDIQGEEGVDFQRAWGDPDSGMVWCISEAPNAEAVRKIHERTGHPATEIYPVPVEV